MTIVSCLLVCIILLLDDVIIFPFVIAAITFIAILIDISIVSKVRLLVVSLGGFKIEPASPAQ